MRRRLRVAIAALALALAVASPALAKAGASITGPDDGNFGEVHELAGFDSGHARVDPDNLWARVDCYLNETTISPNGGIGGVGLIYAEYLYLGSRTYVVNDELMTLGPTPSWSGGGADCTATLLAYDGNGGFRSLAADDFTVAP